MPSTRLPTKVANRGPDPLNTPNARANAPVAATCMCMYAHAKLNLQMQTSANSFLELVTTV